MDRFYEGGTIPWIKSGELRESVINSAEEFVTEAALKETSIKLVPAGALLVAMYGATVGRLGILGIDATTNQAVCHILPDPNKAELRYLYHAMLERVPKLILMGVGGAQPNISQGLIKDLQIPIPPLPEQRRIAQILDKAEALRAKRRAALAKLDTLAQSIFLEMFGGLKENDKGWKKSKIGQAGKAQLGRQRAPQYQTGKFTRPYVRVANVYEDRLSLGDVLSMDFDENDFLEYKLEYGDILLNEGQSTELVGRPAMWRDEIQDCCFQNTLIRFQPDKTRLIPDFVMDLFLAYYRSGEFSKLSSKTSSVAHLGLSRFVNLEIPLPPIGLQNQYVEKKRAIESLKAAHRASLAKLDALFASLQHRAFRGEL